MRKIENMKIVLIKFVKNSRDKCKMIIDNKKYEITDNIILKTILIMN